MRIVLDTNILVSALLTSGTPPDLLYKAWEAGWFELLTSDDQMKELNRVLRYDRLQPYLLPGAAQKLLHTIGSEAAIVNPVPTVSLSPDPDDNTILAIAVAGKADLVITGDKRDLLALQSIQSIPIVPAHEGLRRLNERFE